ncbi:MAG TPA: SAM-dependent methyltransferase [Yinghuangia sp.]|uniref:class I SAM-dependent methyltransferase n=1 Tax=Yinghuangia sp. YIM S10712 TaxID=3436930 RepID=UPI002CE57755|nr:SAM-dependent methyltransferase [Yinghuangia sp.]
MTSATAPRSVPAARPAPRPPASALPPAHALEPYERALAHGTPLYLRRTDGSREPLDIGRWTGSPDRADASLLARCAGATLDIGCGPGRLVAALVRRGLPALGIDLAATAVRLTIRGGGAALRRSVFDPLPGEGRWSTVLLADGNIGIGGDPAHLLRRVADLTRQSGRVLVETEAGDPYAHERFAARVEDASGNAGAPFRWARLGTRALAELAPACGFAVDATWTLDSRHFVALTKGER